MSAIVPASGTRREGTLAPNYIVLALLLVFAVGPLLVLGFNSLKTQAERLRNERPHSHKGPHKGPHKGKAPRR